MHHHTPDREPTPQEQLDREWQLFQQVEADALQGAWRIWEASTPVVVLGHSNLLAEHVFVDACAEDRVPILRRASGGGAVVLAPGCLNYAIAVSMAAFELTDSRWSFARILGAIAAALGPQGNAGEELILAGGTDLVMNGKKVSGNAQRRARHALLHHGTLLYGFDSGLATRYLKEPRRRPAYRADRRHSEFIGNLSLSPGDIRGRLETALRQFERPELSRPALT